MASSRKELETGVTLSDSSSAEDIGDINIFKEPDGYLPPERPPTFTEHTLLSGELIKLRLVGHNPLWGHHLWNAGKVVSNYLEEHAEELVQGKDVLELGAGAGLPSLTCAIKGAKTVVITDYPDTDLIDNLKYNVQQCKQVQSGTSEIAVEGYLWGAPPSTAMSSGFGLLILADLLFNHSEHEKLLSTVAQTMRQALSSKALVFFTPYRPWLLEKDMAFFEIARRNGFAVEKVMEEVMDEVMFAEDRGDELLRRTVYGYEVRWSTQSQT